MVEKPIAIVNMRNVFGSGRVKYTGIWSPIIFFFDDQ